VTFSTKPALFQNRAGFFGYEFLISLSILSVINNNSISIAVAIAISALINSLNQKEKVAIISTAIFAYFYPEFLFVLTPTAIFLLGYRDKKILIAALSGIYVFPALVWVTIYVEEIVIAGTSLGSLAALLYPALSAIIIAGSINKRNILVLFLAAIIISLGIIYGDHWANISIISNHYFHIAVTIFLISLIRRRNQLPKKEPIKLNILALMLIGAMSIVIIAELTTREIKQITFDESHGKWETVTSELTPESFGRDKLYSYKALFNHTSELGLTTDILEAEEKFSEEQTDVLVIKMPVLPISEKFTSEVVSWIKAGGSLLVIADHTNLYDTTKRINQSFGSKLGFAIDETATFDEIGMPINEPARSSWSLHRLVTSSNSGVKWQTGASMLHLPPWSLPLSSQKYNFAEKADYSHQNRFSDFRGTKSDAFSPHPQIAIFSYGSGSVGILLDSTPLSTFSVYKTEYKKFYEKLIGAMSQPILIKIIPILLLTSAFIQFLIWNFDSQITLNITSIILGAIIAGSLYLTSDKYHVKNAMYAYLGQNAKTEFLAQLERPENRNYSRILAGASKYDINLYATNHPNKINFDANNVSNVILIEPELGALPKIGEIREITSAGKNIGILLEKGQIEKDEYIQYFNSLGINIQKNRSHSLSEATHSNLLDRTSPLSLKRISFKLAPRSTSLFKEVGNNDLIQLFSMRPLKTNSGLLMVSLDAEQFSDDAIGSIWEGVHTNILGAKREEELWQALTLKKLPFRFPNNIKNKFSVPLFRTALFFKDGKLASKVDDLDETTKEGISPSLDERSYAKTLLNEALKAISACKIIQEESLFRCKENKIFSNDISEWRITWRTEQQADLIPSIELIELIHNRRYSGMSNTWNVIFGK